MTFRQLLGKFLWDAGKLLLGKKGNPTNLTIAGTPTETPGAMPIQDGRSSRPTHKNSFRTFNELEEIPFDFAQGWFTSLENLAAYNHDVSFAVDNIVQFANTPHEIKFQESIPQSQQKEMRQFIAENEQAWYQNSAGRHGLKGDLLAQTAINGALSAEIIPGSRRGGVPDHIHQVARIAPKYIKFLYDRENDVYLPFQQPVTMDGIAGSLVNSFDLIPLNTSQYFYFAWRRFFEGPYPTPPFLAAVEGLSIQKDMLNSFKEIMKKLGMLGFLSVEVTPPDPRPGESEEDFFNRSDKYLKDVVFPQVDKNLGQGFAAGFIGSHKFELQGNNMNVQGAEGLMKIVELIIFAGLKQDPNMLGRNFSTTETFGRVILAKTMNQTKEYQRITDCFYAQLYSMALRLEGFAPGVMTVESEAPMVTDRVKEEEAEGKKIDNVIKKRDEGIIDQDQAANDLGQEKPAADGPIRESNSGTDDSGGDGRTEEEPDEQDESTDENTRAAIEQLSSDLNGDLPEFNYGNDDCGHEVTESNFLKFTNFDDPEMRRLNKAYFNDTNTSYQQASGVTTNDVTERLLRMNEASTLAEVNNAVYLQILITIQSEFVVPQDDITEKHVPKIYDHFRKDQTVFTESFVADRDKMRQLIKDEELGYKKYSKDVLHLADDDFVIPDGALGLEDFRAIDYMNQSDPIYLGKFITDKDTQKKIFNFIGQQYVDGDLPLGGKQENIKQFKKKFKNMMGLSAFKIRRIIDTTVNKARNFARIQYMDQAGVTQYEIIEIIDQLTCDWCQHMNHKKFTVATGKAKMMKEINGGPGDVSKTSPFLTNEKIDVVQAMSTDELAANGYTVPAFHPHCRGRTVARILAS